MRRKSSKRMFFLWLAVTLTLTLFAANALAATHTVQPGEYLSKIAPKYGLTWRELHKLNPDIKDPNLIFPGQILDLGEGRPADPTPIPAPAPIPAPDPESEHAFADVILTNGDVFTSNEDAPEAKAVAIKGDKIIYVGDGTQSDLDAITGPDTVVTDLDGRFIMPGIIDAHNQSMLVATTNWYTKLPLTKDKDEFLAALEAEVKKDELKAVWGMMYPADMFDPTVEDRDNPMYGPDKAYIDNFGDGTLAKIPIIIQDNSGHGFWFNAKALEYMEIDENTPAIDEALGKIVRYPGSTEPSGWMIEKMYWEEDLLDMMFAKADWAPPEFLSVKPEQLGPILEDFSQYGVTSLFEARSNEAFYQSVAELEKQGKLHQYYDAGVRFYNDPSHEMNLSNAIEKIREWQAKYQSEHLRINTLKFFMDGVHESGTAAVHEPYRDRADNFGDLLMDKDTLVGVLKRLNDENLDLHLHIIGDRGLSTVLDAVEEVREEIGDAWRIQVTTAHLELVRDEDYGRFATLGVIANVSPHWTGGTFGSGSLRYLGQDRFDRMYRFQPLLEAGATLALSADTTDFLEANRYNPWLGMQIGMTRIDTEYQFREEYLSDTNPRGYRTPLEDVFRMEDLLKGYTMGGAKQLRIDDRLGSIEAGKIANILVLDRSPFDVEVEDVENIRPSAVFFEGKIVKGVL